MNHSNVQQERIGASSSSDITHHDNQHDIKVCTTVEKSTSYHVFLAIVFGIYVTHWRWCDTFILRTFENWSEKWFQSSLVYWKGFDSTLIWLFIVNICKLFMNSPADIWQQYDTTRIL